MGQKYSYLPSGERINVALEYEADHILDKAGAVDDLIDPNTEPFAWFRSDRLVNFDRAMRELQAKEILDRTGHREFRQENVC